MKKLTKLSEYADKAPTLLPEEMDEIDILRLEVASERVGRAEAQVAALISQHAQCKSDFDRLLQIRKKLGDDTMKKYGMGPDDTFDRETRKITRKHVVAEAPVPAPTPIVDPEKAKAE